jgi:predicted MFS family arabinose efflux permease
LRSGGRARYDDAQFDIHRNEPHAGGGYLSVNPRVFILALGTLAIGTDGFMIAGILPSIAKDSGVSVATAGQLVTVFAITYAIASPVLGTLTANVGRKQVLVAAMLVFSAANLVSAGIPSFGWLFASRMAAALGSSIFTPAAMAVAAGLLAPERRGRALAIVNGGLTVAIVLGVPFGTFIGNTYTWRLAFVLVAVLGILAALGVLLLLPSVAGPPPLTLRARLAAIGNPRVATLLGISVVGGVGGFATYTYISPILQIITHLSPSAISGIFVVIGIAGIAGNVLGGLGSDRLGPVPTLVLSIAGFGLSMLVLGLLTMHPVAAPVLVAALVVAVWGVASWALNPALNTYLVSLAPGAIGVLLSFSASALYLGIGLGAAVGGLVIALSSVNYVGIVGALLELVALVALLLAVRLGEPRRAADVATADRT